MGLLIFIAFLPACPGQGRPVRVLVMGATAPWLNPIPSWAKYEPLLELTLIPSTIPVGGMATPQIDTGRRAMRIYFPRSYGELIEDDFMVFEHMFMEFFSPEQLSDMYRAVVDEGLGGFVTIGGITHTSVTPNYAWINSPLNDAFPSPSSEEVFEKWRQYGSVSAKVEVNRDGSLPPVLVMLLPFGIDEITQPVIYYMEAKEGSRIWARSVDGFENPPFLISWTYGRGETWANSIGMGYPWWRLREPHRGGNPYALDVFMNMLLFSAGTELPSDIAQVHSAREVLMNFEDSREWLLSVMEFADRFGANVGGLWSNLDQVGESRELAEAAYLDQDYGIAIGIIEDAKATINDLAGDAIRLKDRALLWTYLIEWFAVAGTLIISGEVLYLIMVRRRLYRESGITRAY